MAATQRLTIFLLQAVQEFADALDRDRSPALVVLQANSGIDGVFYWESRPARAPAWVGFLKPVLASVPGQLTSASASGLLVFKAEGRFFAATFGYGRGFLDQSKVVRQFGLKVALNTIDPDQIRSLDTKTFEDMVVARNTQASRSAALPTFGVDVARDILRAVTGQPREKGFGKRVSGSDAVVLNFEGSVVDVPALCRKLIAAYTSDAYKEKFGWVDDLAIVQDRTAIDALDETLISQLRARDTASTHLAMPDPLDWAEVEAFRIAGTRGFEYEDLDLDEYLNRLDDLEVAGLTIELLKSRKVQVRFARSTEWDARWSLYQSLVSEQGTADGFFVLIEGRWFEISRTLAQRVDTFIARLEHTSVALLPSSAGEAEPAYNKRLAEADPNTRVCLDAKIINPGGASSGIEFCDVFTVDGAMVHVKRKSRSSTLSHLFAQGVVAATTLLSDGEFREKLRDQIAQATDGDSTWSAVIPGQDQQPARSAYTVSYVVIANSTRSDNTWLPFFSRLNLMLQARNLENLGIKFTLDRVDAG